MKHIIILGDGMADERIASLGGRTPLEAAKTPTLDRMAPFSKMGMLKTVPEGFHPGSEVANMSVLGYNLHTSFEGRGPLEAASLGVVVEDDEIAMRCNLICIENGKIKNHSAGHISSEESFALIEFLTKHLGNEYVRFFPGISYRHLLKIKGGDKRIDCTPPHDVPGTPFGNVLIKPMCKEAAGTALALNELILESQKLLENHPINQKRRMEGKDPANSIWPWSPGYRPVMPTLQERFGIGKGAVISAVDLIRGIGIYAGLTPVIVEGVTGLWNTNYEGKAQAAINALKDNDFVFLHIEASDEAGHEGDAGLKVQTIESLDSRICKPILEHVEKMSEQVRIAVLPDHPTPCRLRTHTSNPVPVMIYNYGEDADGIREYSENTARQGSLGMMESDEFIKEFLKR